MALLHKFISKLDTDTELCIIAQRIQKFFWKHSLK